MDGELHLKCLFHDYQLLSCWLARNKKAANARARREKEVLANGRRGKYEKIASNLIILVDSIGFLIRYSGRNAAAAALQSINQHLRPFDRIVMEYSGIY